MKSLNRFSVPLRLKPQERAERIGRNPQTNEPITIPAAKVPGFKAGQTLKDAVQIKKD